MRALPPALLAVVAARAAAPAAHAATVHVEIRCANPTGKLEACGTTLAFRAAPGETNDVTADPPAAGSFVIHDAGAPLTARPGCAQVDATSARCPIGIGTVSLGDGNDRLAFPAAVTSVTVSGDAGNDVLSAATVVRGSEGDVALFGDHTINGGLHGTGGKDELSGRGGDDELYGEGTLDGGDGDDLVSGGYASDTLRGGDGDDRLEGSGGADLMEGGAGDDLLDSSEQLPKRSTYVDELRCGSGRDRVTEPDVYDRASSCERIAIGGGLVVSSATLVKRSGPRVEVAVLCGRPAQRCATTVASGSAAARAFNPPLPVRLAAGARRRLVLDRFHPGAEARLRRSKVITFGTKDHGFAVRVR